MRMKKSVYQRICMRAKIRFFFLFFFIAILNNFEAFRENVIVYLFEYILNMQDEDEGFDTDRIHETFFRLSRVFVANCFGNKC